MNKKSLAEITVKSVKTFVSTFWGLIFGGLIFGILRYVLITMGEDIYKR